MLIKLRRVPNAVLGLHGQVLADVADGEHDLLQAAVAARDLAIN